jgi:protein-S-isoprenylcysteine O-methyltransferase Ste14
MIDFLAVMTLMFWPVIPLFWIPVHIATGFFKKIGRLTYVLPIITWLPLAYLIYHNRDLLLKYKIDIPLVFIIAGILCFTLGTLLHIWTARLLGIWGIIGMPEISTKAGVGLITKGPFSIVRHPTYLAHTLMFSGAFLITGVATVALITILDFITVKTIIIPLEERELLSRFGEIYISYMEKVPSRFFHLERRRRQ